MKNKILILSMIVLGSAMIFTGCKKDTDKTVEDLEKAAWYLNRKIEQMKNPEYKLKSVNAAIV